MSVWLQVFGEHGERDGRETVACDEDCGAFSEPATLEEYKAALEHWMDHAYLSGCSHGN